MDVATRHDIADDPDVHWRSAVERLAQWVIVANGEGLHPEVDQFVRNDRHCPRISEQRRCQLFIALKGPFGLHGVRHC
jgi:hypothetical protein